MWLYDGRPEFIDVNVASATPTEGGYVMAMELTNGAVRLAATRHPGRYVSAWRHNVRRYGAPDVVRVVVSRPYLRYEAVKRALAGLLAGYKDAGSENFMVGIDILKEKAGEMFSTAS
ncbi:hypothetical protein [Pelomicrobium methylotrophicum]|uniref:Uncharacterized protein n=1 Tax=Pelomicrobium methylotrophicum TaxID=2602750 RepID=A0A5C7EJM6_9PROT|nr:hypothetical protein [Pelomicrobium methylotrophicum]TXF11188.1 hypothetical protein FR698_11795 [Pelomicrobium methylotrophicum]